MCLLKVMGTWIFENYILNSNEKLESSVALSSLNTFEDIDTTDRVFLFPLTILRMLKMMLSH